MTFTDENECPICTEPYNQTNRQKHLLHPPAPCAMCRRCLVSLAKIETERERQIRTLEVRGYTRRDAECLVAHMDDDYPFIPGSFDITPGLRCPFDRTYVLCTSVQPKLVVAEKGVGRFERLFALTEISKLMLIPLAVSTYSIRVLPRVVERVVPVNPLLERLGQTAPFQYFGIPTILNAYVEEIVYETVLVPAPMGTIMRSSFAAGFLCDLAISSVRDLLLHIFAQPAALYRTPPLWNTIRSAVLSSAIHAAANYFGGNTGLLAVSAIMLCVRKVPG
eukprot:comp65403_c0_seq1/m.47991 comp65403_c0_seq1/g.47991  ORF comp65403_c0_seq1/g.47991 comp65403_c0_seq1/m.47991 type:complete len:278 (-) comp65403_c0_seq1:778-1611(-)